MCIYAGRGGGVGLCAFGLISLKLIKTEVKAKIIIKGIMGQCIYVHGFGNFTGDFP